MKPHILITSSLLVAMTAMVTKAHAEAPEPLDWMTGNNGCHVLLTEKECATHRATLLAITSVAQRYAYLDAHGIPLREREAMCSCKRNAPATVYYPGRLLHLAHR